MLKEYEKVETIIYKASISKLSHNLWYLCEGVIMSLLDDEVDRQSKKKKIANFNRDRISDFSQRYDPSEEKLTQKLFDKTLDDLVSEKSKQFLSRLQIDDSFLKEDVSSWNNNAVYLEAKRRISRLRVVNDTADHG
ncbi:hypothetical protein QYM36_009602 [Artemia franciscana]|uniref:Uncharacterized protein n=1 Tax=Artemia franciscana TaxID=6661 RepID=A0AA88L239_ARTSF|nr:hypothetical protein QYM36_009602 [Artemia franciscana]